MPLDRPELVPRARLLSRLVSTPQPLVVLTAPAGYGKTTTVAQWIRSTGRESAWLTVQEDDGDPVLFLHRILAAVDEAGGDPRARHEPNRDPASVSALASRLVRLGGAPILVFDEIQRLRGAAAANLLVQLALHLPTGAQIVLAGRTSASFRLARLRAEGRCVEFGPEDLAFDLDEIRCALRRLGVTDEVESAQALLRRTEGWPAGVYLSALALGGNRRHAPAPFEITGEDTFIADYFREELLLRQSPAAARFLLRTAPLEQLSADLCDAVLATSGSAVMLGELERENLFVVPLDHRREWYRYHRLFGESLVAELRRREPGEAERIHRRAAQWYESRGLIEQAMHHWLRTDDLLAACRVLNAYGAAFIAVGALTSVQRWVEGIGEAALAAFPPAQVTAAWVAALRGRPGRADALLLQAERSGYSGPMPDGHASLEASILLVRAMMGGLGIGRMVHDARAALALEPPGSRWRGLCSTVLGIAVLLHGSPDEARRLFEDVRFEGLEEPKARTALATAQLSLLEADAGAWGAATAHADEALDFLAAAGCEERMTSVVTYLAAARADLHRGRRSSAERHLGTAVRRYLDLPPTGFGWMAAQTALILAELSLEFDDVAAARTRIEDARRHLARLMTEGVLRDRLRAVSAAVARRGVSSSSPSPMTLSTAEDRVLRLLPTHLSLAEIATELFVSRHTVKAHAASIYRKLGVSGRTDAVKRARDLGLLAP